MGNGNSKPSTDIKSPAKYYDAIAVHYILTQNFKDLNALTTTKGCNKLVILTEKVLKKFLNFLIKVNHKFFRIGFFFNPPNR